MNIFNYLKNKFMGIEDFNSQPPITKYVHNIEKLPLVEIETRLFSNQNKKSNDLQEVNSIDNSNKTDDEIIAVGTNIIIEEIKNEENKLTNSISEETSIQDNVDLIKTNYSDPVSFKTFCNASYKIISIGNNVYGDVYVSCSINNRNYNRLVKGDVIFCKENKDQYYITLNEKTYKSIKLDDVIAIINKTNKHINGEIK